MNYRSICLLLLFFGVTTTIWGQKSDNSNVVYFNQETFIFNSNFQLQDKDLPINFTSEFDGRFFGFLHFTKLPEDNTITQMEQIGVVFLGYIPNNTYSVSIPSNLDITQLKPFNADVLVPHLPKWKLSNNMIDRPFPDYAYNTMGKLKLIVEHYKTIASNKVIIELKKLGFEVTGSYPFSNLINIEIDEKDIDKLAFLPFTNHIELVAPPSEPEGLQGRSLHRSNLLNTPNGIGNQYNGAGINVGVGDDGIVGPHIDFEGRLDNTYMSNFTTDGTHGDMVTGIFAGAGNRNPYGEGMASGSKIFIFQTKGVIDSIPSSYVNDSIRVTNHSYSNGCNAGYTTWTVKADQQINQMPYLLHVFSAGNSGTSDCGYGAGNDWGNVTGGIKIAKNVIAVANLNVDGSLRNSSSRGPAHDGRIKPDISSHGNAQFSTDPNHEYSPGGGTSAAAPGVAGVCAQLMHAHKIINGFEAESPLIKAVVLNSAEDLGNSGPDFKYGYGRINAYRALRILEEHTYQSDLISQGVTKNHTISVPSNVAELRVMLYWLDPAANTNASFALVNNLNLKLTNPVNTVFYPWVLDPTPNATTLNNPATRGIDNLNNMEQITIENPTAGQYAIEVDGSSIPFGPQKYYLIYHFIPNEILVTFPSNAESVVPSEAIYIRWDAPDKTKAFDIEYSSDSGNTWSTITSGLQVTELTHEWTVPNTITGQAKIRVTAGGITGENAGTFNIISVPQGLNVTESCVSNFTIEWDTVQGADYYTTYLLGTNYMMPIDTTSQLEYTFQNTDVNQDYWYSVSAHTNNGANGRRAIAENRQAGTYDCFVNNDLGITEIINPPKYVLQSCHVDSNLSVSIEIFNYGNNTIDSFTITYYVDNQFGDSLLVVDSILGGNSSIITFDNPLIISGSGTTTISFQIFHNLDSILFNDTVSVVIDVINTPTQTLPFTENFDSYSTCSTNANCEQDRCIIPGGWYNLKNIDQDDIDWRVDDDGTRSVDTGPEVDHTTGTNSGNYIYLEASGGCDYMEAQLLSPCIDLTNSIYPVLTFWYHMYGEDMGELHLDVYDGFKWLNDIMPPISGDQGDVWIEQIIPLYLFIDKIITLRFRGVTGSSYQSDVALDDIYVSNWTLPPLANFESDFVEECVGNIISLTDLSIGATSWSWDITPTAYQYVNGTSSTSQHPQLIFNASGLYTITLTATNQSGSDTKTLFDYIEIKQPGSIPVTEDFENFSLLSTDWSINNTDNNITWSHTNFIPGSFGQPTRALSVNNYIYPDKGQEDAFVSFPISLTGIDNPYLSFDVSHAPYSASFKDGLRIDVSIDCGHTYTDIVYYKLGNLLATAPAIQASWVPINEFSWRNEWVDLSQYAGIDNISIKFVNVNDYGNNIYIDNILINGIVVMNADFTASIQRNCVGDTIIFNDNSYGAAITDYYWSFGQGATPLSATDKGPHIVVYSTPGQKSIMLTTSGNNISDNAIRPLNIIDVPESRFTHSSNSTNIVFNNGSLYASHYQWFFGDGTTSTLNNPVHNYNGKGTYNVTLISENICGSDTLTKIILINSINDINRPNLISVFPNPSNGVIYYQINNMINGQFQLFNVTGKLIKQMNIEQPSGEIDISNFAKGIYILKFISKNNSQVIKLTLQ